MNLQLGMSWGGALLRRDQAFEAALVTLRHEASLPAASGQNGASDHSERTEGRKERLRSHEFLNRKIEEAGIREEMDRRIGVWSEVGLGRGEREVLGKAREWSRLTKALSSRAITGTAEG